MAVALQSNSSYQIVSQDGSQSDKSVFLIKLTDSCLKSLEQHKNQIAKYSKPSLPLRPSIQFKDKGKAGSLLIPSKSGLEKDATTFNFGVLLNDASTAGLDCFQQKKGEMGLIMLGNITGKITVNANNDIYQTTRDRMAEAENKRKGSSAKVIELSSCDGAKKSKRNPNRKQQFAIRKLKTNNKFTQSSSSSSKGLREKVIHLLALKPLNKLELRQRLVKDGVKLKDPSELTGILQQVSAMQDNHYNLHRHLYSEIQVDSWPSYTDEDREAIKTKLVSEMGTSVERLSPGPLASGIYTNNPSKRPLSGGANPLGKKQRIAHSTNNTKPDGKKTSEKSPPKITSRRASETVTQTKPRREHQKLNHKLEKPPTNKTSTGNTDHSKPSNTNNNDKNNNYSLTEKELSNHEDYLTKYPKITSYEQRCLYKEEFTRGYADYTTIKERCDLVSKEFTELKERLEGLAEDGDAAKAIHAEIFKLYNEKKEEWTKDRQKMNVLYPKLSHIKELVIQYDQAHAGFRTTTPTYNG